MAYRQTVIEEREEGGGVGGEGRPLALACGPGPISFALHRRFDEVWAVDQEPDMVGVARQKAEAAGIGNIRFLASAPEDLSEPEQSFDLVAIRKAFHRLPPGAAAAPVFPWLRPAPFPAPVWRASPSAGPP